MRSVDGNSGRRLTKQEKRGTSRQVSNAVRTISHLQADALLSRFFSQSIFQNIYHGYVVGTELRFTAPAQLTVSSVTELCLAEAQ